MADSVHYFGIDVLFGKLGLHHLGLKLSAALGCRGLSEETRC